ncbi:MAG: phenylalanine--tRNA ligase subunit alpha [Candidatus Omnitrophota bacterium]
MIEKAQKARELQEIKNKYLSRNGLAAQLFKLVPQVEEQYRADVGGWTNNFKKNLETRLQEKAIQLCQQEENRKQRIDVTMPGVKRDLGSIHPLTQMQQQISRIFIKLGFKVADGPEIESDYYNFTALNIPSGHPSRETFHTFYLNNGRLLRSQTSPVQIRVMEKQPPPLKIVAPGRVYRPDATDASHSFMFHQIEGLAVDKNITFADLKGTLSVFLRELFGQKTKMRFRPHFFPFTEPSAEIDISCIICGGRGCRVCSGKGWLEILGAGMVHPNVFAAVKYDTDVWQGFAFGMGVERITMLKYGITDIRMFFENDVRFLKQF